MVGCTKVLIIKLGATGDVLRTTPLLRGLKRTHPKSHITWLTMPESREILASNPLIDTLLVYGHPSLDELSRQRFDVLICLDKEKEALSLAGSLSAGSRFGFGQDPSTGELIALNPESGYALRLGIDDDLKFRRNTKTYPEIVFEMCCMPYQRDEYILKVTDEARAHTATLFQALKIGPDATVIGLNTGAGERFANKAWSEEGFCRLIRIIRESGCALPLLLGGPLERERNARIREASGSAVHDAGCDNSLIDFCGIIERCSLIVTGDSTAMHVAVALKVPVVALFGSTAHQEIELYGRGLALHSGIACRPCYRKRCDKETNCMNTLSAERVHQAVLELLSIARGSSGSSAAVSGIRQSGAHRHQP